MEGLDPEIQELIIEMASTGQAPLSELSVGGAREQMEQFLRSETTVGDIDRVTEYLIESDGEEIQLRTYRPDGEGPFPVLLWFHGGGWTVGSIDSYDNLCRALADELDRVVVSVEYRLAPEHPFPTAVNDCYRTLEWATANAGVIDGNGERIAVGGDSAGGNLAAVTALRSRDRDGPAIEHQILAYPATSYPFESDGKTERGYLLEQPDVEWFWSLYLADEVDGKNPYAAPLGARDLSGLPPATVLTCQYDPLHREGAAYAERLLDADVPVTHIHYDDVPHGFLPLLAEPSIERAWDAIEQLGDELRDGSER